MEFMNKKIVLIPVIAESAISPLILNNKKGAASVSALAAKPVAGTLSSKQTIDLDSTGETTIRMYYDSLRTKSEEERTGDNIIKKLKPLLQKRRNKI